MTDSTPREVRLSQCYCAGEPHPDGDRFVLHAEVPVDAGLAAVTALQNVGAEGDHAAALINAMIVNGAISEWNLLDENGERLPITPHNVSQRVTWTKGGVELANAAFAQYVNGKDLGPFGLSSRKPSGKSSPNGQTATSTSPKAGSSRKRPVPSE